MFVSFGLAGCDLFKGAPKIDEDVQAFVERESLPEAQRPEIGFDDSEADVTVFHVKFGPGCDCPSGCFYSTAYGIQYRSRIGWMKVDQKFCIEDSVEVGAGYFDLRGRDSTLFRSDFRGRLREAVTTDEVNDVQAPVYDVFLNMLAKDNDTPSETLLSLAQLLQDDYRPGVGYTLLEHPVVRSSRSILEVLAQLSGTGYETIRERAQALLDELGDEQSSTA
jgi:hypothetical protein